MSARTPGDAPAHPHCVGRSTASLADRPANQRAYKFRLPESADAVGRWLEHHGGNISINCAMGRYCVVVSRQKLHSYSDDEGRHSETWEITRYGTDLVETLGAALEAATTRSASYD